MSTAVMLDTGFLITLVDRNRPNHNVAVQYFRAMVEQRAEVYFSAIAAAEFEVRQPITELPLKHFRLIAFNVRHAQEAGRLWCTIGKHDSGDVRHVVRDDIKLIAQACCESIPIILTEDASTLSKYCEKMRKMGLTQTRAILLADGYVPSTFTEDRQMGLSLDDSWYRGAQNSP